MAETNDEPKRDEISISCVGMADAAIDQLKAELEAMGFEATAGHALMLGADRQPEIVNLLIWGPTLTAFFAPSAAEYIKGWGKAAGEDHYKQSKAAVSAAIRGVTAGASTMRSFVGSLLKLNAPGEQPVTVRIASGGIKFQVNMEDEDAAIDSIATAVHLLPAVALAADSNKGVINRGPFDYVHAMADGQGFRLEWFDKEQWCAFGLRFDVSGQRVGEKFKVERSPAASTL